MPEDVDWKDIINLELAENQLNWQRAGAKDSPECRLHFRKGQVRGRIRVMLVREDTYTIWRWNVEADGKRHFPLTSR